MTFDPEKFYVGLIDFFSILMPGALLAYFGRSLVADDADYAWAARPLTDAESWMVFLFASYLLGHFIFLLGAKIDDLLYDPLRRKTTAGQIGRLAKGKKPSWKWLRALAGSRLLFGSSADAAVMQVERMKTRELGSRRAAAAVNAFQWSKACLSRDHPQGLAAVQRFEADSKFFRSFVVVLAIVAGTCLAQRNGTAAAVCGVLMLLALWRYVDQRFKATQQAYWFMIALEGRRATAPPAAAISTGPAQMTHGGGVVFRRRNGGGVFRRHNGTVEYLLVQSSTSRFEWVLPKGHIEPGENPRETAVREVQEETGHWARVVRWLQDLQLGAAPGAPLVRFYLMESTPSAKNPWPPEHRQHDWLPLAEATQRASFGEARLLLANADRLRADTETR